MFPPHPSLLLLPCTILSPNNISLSWFTFMLFSFGSAQFHVLLRKKQRLLAPRLWTMKMCFLHKTKALLRFASFLPWPCAPMLSMWQQHTHKKQLRRRGKGDKVLILLRKIRKYFLDYIKIYGFFPFKLDFDYIFAHTKKTTPRHKLHTERYRSLHLKVKLASVSDNCIAREPPPKQTTKS